MHAHGIDKTSGTTFGHTRRAESDVKAVSRPCILVEYSSLILGDGQRFSGQQSLISFEIDTLDEPSQGMDGQPSVPPPANLGLAMLT